MKCKEQTFESTPKEGWGYGFMELEMNSNGGVYRIEFHSPVLIEEIIEFLEEVKEMNKH